MDNQSPKKKPSLSRNEPRGSSFFRKDAKASPAAPDQESTPRPARPTSAPRPTAPRSDAPPKKTYEKRSADARPKYPKRDDGPGAKPKYPRRDDGTGAKPAYPKRDDRSDAKPRYPKRDEGFGAKPKYAKRDDHSDAKSKYPRRDDGPGAKPAYPKRDDRSDAKPRYPKRDEGFGAKPKYAKRDDHSDAKPRYPKRDDRDYSTSPTRTPDGRFASRTKVEGKYPPKPEPKYRPRISGKPAPAGRPERAGKSSAKVEKTMPDELRLNRFIAMSGICSRREADQLIAAGEVTVNGVMVDQLGAKVNSTDDIRLNGERLQGEKKVYIILNKPKGYVTTVEDPHADKTVIDLLKGQCPERVYPVGRLDKNTTGVLLLTNDGTLTKELTHPSYEKKKIYHVFLDKACKEADLEKILAGFELEDGFIRVDAASYVDNKGEEVGIELHSGRNRIVRRIFESLGYEVVKLDRVYFAGLTKMALRRGFWRYLTAREVSILKSGGYE